jgi:hypothetical protein
VPTYSALVVLDSTPDAVPAEEVVEALSVWSPTVTDLPDGSREVIVSGEYLTIAQAASSLVDLAVSASTGRLLRSQEPRTEADVLEARIVPDAHHARLEA